MSNQDERRFDDAFHEMIDGRDAEIFQLNSEIGRLTTALAAAEGELEKADKQIELLRHERNVLQKICAERSDELASRDAAIEEAIEKLRKYTDSFHSGWAGEMPKPGFEVVRIVEREMKELVAALSQASGSGEAIANAHRREGAEAAAKVDFRLPIQRAISEIPVSNGAYIVGFQERLHHTLSRALLERIADEAAKAAVASIRALYPDDGGPSHTETDETR